MRYVYLLLPVTALSFLLLQADCILQFSHMKWLPASQVNGHV